jgi:predicted membrane chloride channel (bestrophin family)
MIIPLTFIGCWATAITLIHQLVHSLGIQSTLLTVTGFVVGLALSFRSSTAYERYSEGRKYWSQLLLTSRNLARIIWIHAQERHEESAELGKQDVLAKLAALNLINAFAVSLKHRLRFEPSTEYPDLSPLIGHLHTFAGDADQAALRERKVSSWKSTGQYLGVSFAESNPRKLVKRSKDNLGNTPLEVLTYLSAYIENIFQNKTLIVPVHQTQSGNLLASFVEVLTGVERVVNTPLPIAYSISISQITWAYVLALPFQLVYYLQWVTIPGTIVAGYIILGIAQIGRELENPFGQDVNDLPLDAYCQDLANDIDVLTSQPPPLKTEEWMQDGGAKVLWPLSSMEYKAWENRSLEEIRSALKLKAASREVKLQRKDTMILSDAMTNEA